MDTTARARFAATPPALEPQALAAARMLVDAVSGFLLRLLPSRCQAW